MALLHAKKKSKGNHASASRGFGAATVSTAKNKNIMIPTDKSKLARDFYAYLEETQGVTLLSLTRLGFFDSLRGVVALQDVPKGKDLISIPSNVAVNLGGQGVDPVQAGVNLVQAYRAAVNEPKRIVFDVLPPLNSTDCLGSTDFYSDEALQALQSPTIVEETLARRERVRQRTEQQQQQQDDDDDSDEPELQWIDGTPLTFQQLQWATWIVTSRVLTVQSSSSSSSSNDSDSDQEQSSSSFRLYIPYLDMANHDRNSPHVLTGRVGGDLKLTAAKMVKAGEQVCYTYGGGMAGNDRIIQDYGFVDTHDEAFDLTAQQIMGKRRLTEGTRAGLLFSIADRQRTLEALGQTSIVQDEALLEQETDFQVKMAIQYRLGVKKALARMGEGGF